MAESLMRAAMLAFGMATVANVAAQALPDPTRPPASLHAGTSAAPASLAAPILQSVLISPGRKVAVISGETVQVGDRIGDARVARIAEGEVVLTNRGQSQTLKLFPGIDKRRTNSGAEARETGRRQ